MIRPVTVTLASLFSLLLFWAANARAEDEILKLVPQQALGLVLVNRPAAADAKLQQLGQQMKLPIPSLLAKLQGPNGIREGLDKNRPIALLALPPTNEKGPLTPLALIPVTNYAKFLEQFKSEGTESGVTKIEFLDAPAVVRSVGSYAAITEFACREVLEKDVKLADEVPAALAPWRTWLAEKDAAVVVLASGNPLDLGQGARGDRPHQADFGPGRRTDETGRGGSGRVRDVLPGGREGGRVLRPRRRARCARRAPHFGAGPAGARRGLGRVFRRAETVETQRPGGAAGRALRDRRRRSALRGDDGQADGFLFRPGEEPARNVRAERRTGEDVLRAFQRTAQGNPRPFPRTRRGPRRRVDPCTDGGHHARQEQPDVRGRL